jgi:transcription termination factor Rho|tara:strand:- start:1651 stop:3507 length:1857 start_codon:yes stop_codon:yes gene_type:complete
MALTRSKKSRGKIKEDEVSSVDEVNEKSPSPAGGTEADGSREKTSRKKSKTLAQSVSESEKKPSQGKESQQVFFSTDGSEPTEEKGPPPAAEESDQGKHSSAEGGQKDKNRQGHRKPRQQNWQNKKRGGGGKGKPQQFNQNQKQRHKSNSRRRTSLSDPEERHPLELGTLQECEALADFDAIDALVEECIGGEGDVLEFNSLYGLDLVELKEKATALLPELDFPPAPVREEIFDLIFQNRFEGKIPVKTSGVLEVLEEGYGLLLQAKDNYRIKSQSPFVPKAVVKRFGLQTGHLLEGFLRPKMEGATCPLLIRVETVMGKPPEEAAKVIPFTELTPYYPLSRIFLETSPDVEWDNVSMRVVDLVSPIGFGQRGLIVAPPRTGKTVLQQCMARAIRTNNPDTHLIILLVDERPEEVTDFRRQVSDAEIIASTFDENAESHVHAAEIVIEKARRMVEVGKEVVILLDSITRLARAYNTTMPNSGKILSGGVEASALQRPKRFFGSARNIEGGGSLTILGTALIDTGSKMDEVIFEEFKGTGNMELHLDRELVSKRIFPALDFEKSGTRKEELLYHPDELGKIYALRRSLKGVPPVDAMEMFIQRVKKTKNNPEFLMGLGR